MSWDIYEKIFDDIEDAKKEYPWVRKELYVDTVESLDRARLIASLSNGNAAVIVPFVSSTVEIPSQKAQKILSEIQKVQENSRKNIFQFFQQFKVSRLKCKHCGSLSNMSFFWRNSFPFEMSLVPNENASVKYNFETDRCVDEWRILDEDKILHMFACPVCRRVENITADKVRKIIEHENNKLLVLQEKLFSEIAGEPRTRYLICWMKHM